MNRDPKINYLAIPIFQVLCILGMALSLFQYLDRGRLPVPVYLGFGLIQLLPVMLHFAGRNFLTAIFGFCITIILILAVVIELTPDPQFDAVFAASAYTPPVIEKAYHALLFSSSLYHLVTVGFVPKRAWVWTSPDQIEERFARHVASLFLLGGLVVTFLTVRGSSIADAPYASYEYGLESGLVHSAGAELLSMFFLVFGLVGAVRGWGYNSKQFRAVTCTVLLTVIYFRVLRGDRASSLGVFTTLALVYFIGSRHSKRLKYVLLGFGTILLFLFFEFWGTVRTKETTESFSNALVSGLQEGILNKVLGTEINPGFDPLRITLLPQSYWQLLHTVDLYDSNISLNGTSFVDLIPQSIPQFLCDLIGFERPMNGAWRLAEYRVHGGGMFVIAEGYWNFGLFGAAIVALGLALMAILLENWHRGQEPILYCTYFAFLGTFGFGIYYGLQPLVKAFEIALSITVIMNYMLKWYRFREVRLQNAQSAISRFRTGTAGLP